MTGTEATHEYRPRLDPELAGAFAKNASDEQFLDRLNAHLFPHAQAEYLDLEESVPTLHVIGVPRSGTTLLHQALVSRLELGYVDNLVAAFWRAPTYGLRLSQKLGVAAERSSFESSFGRTAGVGEPHEFGYFWNDQLRYPDLTERGSEHDAAIDWEQLRRVLVNMAYVSGAPMIFKPMLLLWHLETALRYMPLSCFVWIRRDARQVALSLLKMRESVFGTLDHWASLRPVAAAELGGEDPIRQVVAQALVLERTISASVERMGEQHVVSVQHEELCHEPNELVAAVQELLARKGADVGERGPRLESFEQRRNEELELAYGDRVDEALERVSARLEHDTNAREGGAL